MATIYHCLKCNHDFQINEVKGDGLQCPKCGSNAKEGGIFDPKFVWQPGEFESAVRSMMSDERRLLAELKDELYQFYVQQDSKIDRIIEIIDENEIWGE